MNLPELTSATIEPSKFQCRCLAAVTEHILMVLSVLLCARQSMCTDTLPAATLCYISHSGEKEANRKGTSLFSELF